MNAELNTDRPVATTARTMESTGSLVIPPNTIETMIAPTIALDKDRVIIVHSAPADLSKLPNLI